MPLTTLPKPRTLPAHLAHAVATYIGPVPRYAPGERATACGPYPLTRAGGSRLAACEQSFRLREQLEA